MASLDSLAPMITPVSQPAISAGSGSMAALKESLARVRRS
jgi:hypothetical protein